MKTSRRTLFYEIVAAAHLGVGALLLVHVYLPLINPDLYAISIDERGRARWSSLALEESTQSLMYYLLGTLLALVVLGVAWRFNVKALRSRDEA